MARRVIRADTDRIVSDKSGWLKKPFEVTVYRIEWPDGDPTGTGLFQTVDAAQRYAGNRGWPVDLDIVSEQREVSA